ncbi:MAG: hypothetical protein ABIN20_03575 [candidate division WOR-3 bacterium]
MKKIINIITVINLITILGCREKQTEPTLNDEEILKQMINESEFFKEFDEFSEWNFITTFSDIISNFIVNWGREINNIIKDINIHIEGDSAIVTINKDVKGTLHIIATSPDTFINLSKPLHHKFTRYALFKKTDEKKWRLNKISGGESQSLDIFTVRIDSVKIEIPSINYVRVYKNPLDMINVEDIIKLKPGDSVLVTYYTNGENSLSYIHPRPFLRRILEPYGNGIFKGKYHAPLNPGIYHVAFDVIRWESIMTKSYPFEDANIWFFAYKVEK